MKYIFILLFSFFSSVIYAQNGAVVGKITDSDNGLPLPGANIILKGTDYGTISDVSGNFVLPNVIPSDYTLIITYIGYSDIEKELNQLQYWFQMGLIDYPIVIDKTAVDWTDHNQSLDRRARSYLDINCGHCHRESGNAASSGLYLNL